MKKKYFLFLRIFSLFILFSTALAAQDNVFPQQPQPPRLVNDFAGILSADEVNMLESKLLAFNDSTSNQLAVVIVPTLSGYEPADYSFKLGNQWGIGREKLRNGILILIKPKSASERGQAFIATGKGLEGAIPDATCFDIVNKEMIPYFKQNDYYGGIAAATDVLMALSRGEYNSDEYASEGNGKVKIPWAAIIIASIIIIINLFMPRRRRGYTIGRGGYYRGGGFFGGGGFSRGGGGGGGFGGFGGGSFGGGGSGGSW